MFLLNSRLGLFTAALQGFNTLKKHPFSRSYGVILPSSLTRVLSHTLGFSPRLPVSVCGTGTHFLARGFSWQCGIRNFGTIIPSPSQLSLHADGIFLTCCLTAWTRLSNSALTLSSCVPPSLKRKFGGTGISTCYPSPTLFSLGLGPD